jgi:hypothetical protein
MTRPHDKNAEHDLRDRVARALEGTGRGVLVGYFPGYDDLIEPARERVKPALPGIWRIELCQEILGAWIAQAWRNGVWSGTGYALEPLAAAQRARRSAKLFASADWAWRFGERHAVETMAQTARRGGGWSNL